MTTTTLTPETLHAALLARGLPCRVRRGSSGDEVVLETCTFCGNAKHNLELNLELGVYHCWACRTGGQLGRLLSTLLGHEVALPRIAHRPRPRDRAVTPTPVTTPLVPGSWAAHYLATERGISLAVAAQYGLGVCVDPNHAWLNRITIPMRNWEGVVVGHMARSFTGRMPKYLTSVPPGVLTGWRSVERAAPHVIVEGAFDGIAVHRAGCHVVVLSGTGGRGAILQEWVGRLALQHTPPDVVILLDGDAAERSQQLRWMLEPLVPTVRQVVLPEHLDPADLAPPVLRRLLQEPVTSS